MSFIDGLKGSRKEWVRDSVSGNRGYLVEENGVTVVRLDRPLEVIHKRYDPERWHPDGHNHPLTRAQVAQICHASIRELYRFTGKAHKAKEQWLDLPERERVRWIEGKGPKDKRARDFFNVMYSHLEPLTRDGE